jgi:hypothetical protein
MMAALWVTIDNLDGTSTVKGPVYPDEIDTHGMLFKLSEAKIAGITFTRANPLDKLAALKVDTPETAKPATAP